MSNRVLYNLLSMFCLVLALTACEGNKKTTVETVVEDSATKSTFVVNMVYDTVQAGIYYDREADCFHITNAQGLVEFRNVVLGDSKLFFKVPKRYESEETVYRVVLEDDINMADIHSWQPIPKFVGVFDGQGHRIKNMMANQEISSLFVYVGSKKGDMTEIKNLVLEVKDVNEHARMLCVAYVLHNAFVQDCSLLVEVPPAKVKAQIQVVLAGTIYESTVVHSEVKTVGRSYNIKTLFGLYAHDVKFVGCMKVANIDHDFVKKDSQSCLYVCCISQVNVRYREKRFLEPGSESMAYSSYILPTEWEDLDVIIKRLNQGCVSWKKAHPDVVLKKRFYKESNVVYLE